MKILHINTFDTGGAATACRRIHLGLLKLGVDSKVLYLVKSKNIPETYQFPIENTLTARLRRVLGKFRSNTKSFQNFPCISQPSRDLPVVEAFTSPLSAFDITTHPLYKEATIIQLNWVSGFLDEPSFFEQNHKPVVWRMPDLYACGGGNHYEKHFPFKEFSEKISKNKQIREKALKQANITFVPISNWVKEKADESQVIGSFRKELIHNGVDLSTFKSYNKEFSRRVFNLPKYRKLLLFGADSMHNERKGFKLLMQAVAALDSDFSLVIFGKIPDNMLDRCSKEVISIGEIGDEKLLSILYSAVDYFIMPSVEEAFGQVTIEALSVGTPVISFPNGGSLDIIKNGINGVLADDFTAKGLEMAIKKALTITFSTGDIIADIHQRFNIDNKVQQYLDLYKKIS